jgi:hypothetical protein
MKREEVKAIFADATDEQLKQIMDLNGKDVEKEKAKHTSLEDDLKESKKAYDTLTTEFEALKSKNASAEEWETKYNALKSDNEAKEKQALADKLAKEKEENNRTMFEKALKEYGKTPDDWNGVFTGDGYYKKFVEAISLDENTGRAHKDILHDLVKNDQYAFKGVTAVPLNGGRPMGIGSNGKGSRAAELAKKYHANLYGEVKENN